MLCRFRALHVVIFLAAALLNCRPGGESTGEAEVKYKEMVGVTRSLEIPATYDDSWEDRGEVIYYVTRDDRTSELMEYSLENKTHRAVARVNTPYINYGAMSRDGKFYFCSGLKGENGILAILSRERRGMPFNRITVFTMGHLQLFAQLLYDDWRNTLYVVYPRYLTREEAGLAPVDEENPRWSPSDRYHERCYARIDLSREPYEFKEYRRGGERIPFVWWPVFFAFSKNYEYRVKGTPDGPFLCRRARAGGPWERLVKTRGNAPHRWSCMPLNGERACLFFGPYYYGDYHGKEGLNYVSFDDPNPEDDRYESKPYFEISRRLRLSAVQPPAGGGVVVVRDQPDNEGSRYVRTVTLLDFDEWKLTPLFKYPEPVRGSVCEFVVAWLSANGEFKTGEDAGYVSQPYCVIR
jgi:hypothetical protein